MFGLSRGGIATKGTESPGMVGVVNLRQQSLGDGEDWASCEMAITASVVGMKGHFEL